MEKITMRKELQEIKKNVIETALILRRIQELKADPEPTPMESRQLEELWARFDELNPRMRFAWTDGHPVMDIWREMILLEKSGAL